MKSAMTSQERVRTAIARKVPDRVPIQDGPWWATVRRWEREGLPEGKSPADHFGYEIHGLGADLSPRFPVKVLDENDEYIVETTPMGGVRRNHRDRSTTPEIIECPIKQPGDWPAIRERLKPDLKRMDWASSWSGVPGRAREGEVRHVRRRVRVRPAAGVRSQRAPARVHGHRAGVREGDGGRHLRPHHRQHGHDVAGGVPLRRPVGVQRHGLPQYVAVLARDVPRDDPPRRSEAQRLVPRARRADHPALVRVREGPDSRR